MASRSFPLSICQSCLRTAVRRRPQQLQILPRPAQHDHHRQIQEPPFFSLRAQFSSSPSSRASSSTPSSSSAAAEGKPIVLEQPDKFRPPSHPQRLARRRPRASYNQGTTRAEKEQQQGRSYPHTFPNQGTFMHWFLTNRVIHLWITMGTLTFLALVTMTQTFMKTSPYAHLIPPITTFPFHPITYIRESLSVVRLHIDYTTEKANESRQQKILDAQKRRLYRRAHGMEDLNAEEESGIDVRGLVPWDDGLTNAERERGGREERLTGKDVLAMGGKVGDDVGQFARELKEKEDAAKQAVEYGTGEAESEAPAPQQQQQQQQPQRKRKLYFGIW